MKLELVTGYIADAIIEVKKEKFRENFATIQEVSIIRKLIEQRLNEKNIPVLFLNSIGNGFNIDIDNDIITKTTKETLKISLNEDLAKIIYDSSFIYYCLCQILINKLNNSIEHACDNCINNCTKCFKMLSTLYLKEQINRNHDFITACKDNFSPLELLIIAENQRKEDPVLTKYETRIRRLSEIIRKDFAEDE